MMLPSVTPGPFVVLPQSYDATPPPDNQKIIWPLQADAKNAICVLLKASLESLGLTGDKEIPIRKNGTFHQSYLFKRGVKVETEKGPDGFERIRTKLTPENSQPLIIVGRESDVAVRIGVGEQVGEFQTPQMIDPDGLLAGVPQVNVQGQNSDERIDIWIFDTNSQRADQIYTMVKLTMIAIQRAMIEQLGFWDVSRVGGGDGQDIILENVPGMIPVVQRTLTYRVLHVESITLVDQIAQVVAQTLHAEPSENPDGDAEITTII